MEGKSVRVLSLSAKEDGSSTLYRLKQGMVLQFRLGPSLLGCKIDVWTNHPSSVGEAFERTTFRKLQWQYESNNTQDDTAAFINLELNLSGSFRYHFSCDSEDVGGEGYYLVDPELTVGSLKTSLPLDCIQCQTVLAKNLGKFSTWKPKLKVGKECGYNMIHFTPVQALGASNSGYSLADQHNLNVTFETDWSNLDKLVQSLDSEWNMLSICDIVLNHTANETTWILDHADATYNCLNSPHLRPACMLDRVLFHLALDIEKGKWVDRGIPKGEVSRDEHLATVKSLLYDHYFPKVNLFEYFLMDIPDLLDQFEKKILATDPPSQDFPTTTEKLVLIPDSQYRRLKATVDLDLAMKLHNLQRGECSTEENRILVCCSELKKRLDQLNHEAYNEAWSHINAAVENVIKGARYHRVHPDGPRQTACGRKMPLVCQYFTGPSGDITLLEEEAIMFSKNGAQFMAHNGWVMDHDPLVNFALPGSNVYLRRELVAWGDSVKLRFGDKPEDSPFLWQYMKQYAEQTARIFHGIRLDNCHSTPIHVAEFMLDAARLVRPNLYVIAELFTSSEGFDNIFINRLGINSLIREAMKAWDSHELGRLVHRFGGEPVGSFLQPLQRPLVPSMAHALLFDQTHDNQSPIDTRSVYDLLPSAALICMASCACGSNRGYDELVPHHIHVVDESRSYQAWGNGVHEHTGIVKARHELNELHHFLGAQGFNEVYVDQMDYDIVAVTRHCPTSHESFVMVSHTVFSKDTNPNALKAIKPVCVEGQLLEVVLEARLIQTKESIFKMQDTVINGLDNYEVEIAHHINITDSKMACLSQSKNTHHTQIDLKHFPPGSIIVFRFKLHDVQSDSAQSVRSCITTLYTDPSIFADLSLLDIHHALFKCDQEERADGQGGGVYVLDGYGPLKYAGLQGLMSILSEIRPKNDLGNWLPSNLRNGDWLMDYITRRLKTNKGTRNLGHWLETKAFAPLKKVPRYLIPRYFDAIVTSTYLGLLKQTWSLLSPFVQNGSNFNKALALGSVQHTAVMPGATLPTLSPKLAPPAPEVADGVQLAPTIAAGLPHFSTGYMRSWGRDTFIALRGLLILTGRYTEARYIILAYAGCLRHGLIPNLLDGGKNARYNCRDATWWWLHCIISYVDDAPQGEKILKDKVARLFPNDTDDFTPPGVCDQTLEYVMHEALQKHFQGLKFRERNAGRQIDEHMIDQGFNNEIGVDLKTGFVFGGNVHNCGTWMDKMGSSSKAGNKGKPASPRDGSAVEIVGLSYACLKKLAELSANGVFCYNAVERVTSDGSLIKWTLLEWAEKIKQNFDQHFYISRENPNDPRPDLINKVGIYKDTLGSGLPWTDYQLRCNFPIAMAIAPELFNPKSAWAALQIVKTKLLGPLGIATLDPDDWTYRGCYDNSNDSEDSTVSHGFNYHQGPEWVWPIGFFLRAYLHFAGEAGHEEAKNFVTAVLSSHFVEVQQSHWRGIPELTNAKGAFCRDSNPIQAWSMSCLLEVLYELERNSR